MKINEHIRLARGYILLSSLGIIIVSIFFKLLDNTIASNLGFCIYIGIIVLISLILYLILYLCFKDRYIIVTKDSFRLYKKNQFIEEIKFSNITRYSIEGRNFFIFLIHAITANPVHPFFYIIIDYKTENNEIKNRQILITRKIFNKKQLKEKLLGKEIYRDIKLQVKYKSFDDETKEKLGNFKIEKVKIESIGIVVKGEFQMTYKELRKNFIKSFNKIYFGLLLAAGFTNSLGLISILLEMTDYYKDKDVTLFGIPLMILFGILFIIILIVFIKYIKPLREYDKNYVGKYAFEITEDKVIFQDLVKKTIQTIDIYSIKNVYMIKPYLSIQENVVIFLPNLDEIRKRLVYERLMRLGIL